MGDADSFVSYGPQWAEAGSAPFKRHKGYTSEGGITAPMIIAGKGVGRTNEINRSYATVMDIAPTFIALASAQYPDDGSVQAMRGESMQAFLKGSSDRVHSPEYVTTQYHRGRAYLRKGHWKLTQIELPFDETGFSLHDLRSDPGETIDLSEQHPEARAELIELWRQQRQETGDHSAARLVAEVNLHTRPALSRKFKENCVKSFLINSLVLITYLFSGTLAADDLRESVAADYEARLSQLYLHFHQNPELSNFEFETAKRLAAEIRALGYEVTEGVGGAGIVAVLENGAGPTVMIRADMDGLPVKEDSGLSYASNCDTGRCCRH